MPELSPCPFCGSKAKLAAGPTVGMAGSQTWEAFIECGTCGARGPKSTDGAFQPEGVPERVAKLWNQAKP
jgi:hypothetical protein